MYTRWIEKLTTKLAIDINLKELLKGSAITLVLKLGGMRDVMEGFYF